MEVCECMWVKEPEAGVEHVLNRKVCDEEKERTDLQISYQTR